jgi:hypothetical protein
MSLRRSIHGFLEASRLSPLLIASASSSRRTVYGFLAAALILSLLLGDVVCQAFLPFHPTIREWNMSGSWITTGDEPGYTGYFRKTIFIPAEVQNAWLAVSACDVYEVIVNGQEVGNQTIWPPNFPFQYTTTEGGQRLHQFDVNHSFPNPRDYQWRTYANYEIPIFFDLVRFLKKGPNSICIRVTTRKPPVKLCVDGEVLLSTGDRLSLNSGLDWKTATIPRQDVAVSWTEPQYNDLTWPAAAATASPGQTYCSFSPEVFSEPLKADWIQPGREASGRSIWYVAKWNVAGHPDDAWVKLATNRHYALYINGQPVESVTLGPNQVASGDWIVHTRDSSGKLWQPDPMDPGDESSPLNAEPPPDYFRASPGETAGSAALLHNQKIATLDAYGIGSMLREGENEVAVRLIQPGPWLKWTPKLALEATAISTAGRSTLRTNGSNWTVESRSEGSAPQSLTAADTGPANLGVGPTPELRYLGYCYSNSQKFWETTLLGGAVFLAFGLLLAMAYRSVPLLECASGKRELTAGESRYISAGTIVMAFAAAVLGCTMIADASFALRDEGFLFMNGRLWLLSLAASGIVALIVAILLKVASRSAPTAPRLPSIRSGPAFNALLAAVLILCGFVRVYELQNQSSDPDEWASLQAILSIADKGVPMLTPDVFYTRSALYHYLVGGLVAVFGKSVWVFRLPSAVFAVATAALIYLTGKRLFRNRWTGLGAATLFSLHPLLIDIGHQSRFYQQQQFFALLTIYCFCRGFIEGQQMKWRYLTLAALFAAIFSQEISVVIGFTLLPSYILFAERKSWRTELRFLVALGCGMVFVVLDLALWQTVCLTTHAGVSPRLEPELKLNLMYVTMFYWFFFLPSRLHLSSSILLFLGLPFGVRDRNRSSLAICLTFFTGIVLTTIFITGSAVRFQYWLLPLYFLLLVHGVTKLAEWVMKPAAAWFQGSEPGLRGALVSMALATILITWSPWKIPGSYSTKILVDIDGALAFVRHNILPDDALAVEAPHTTAAIVEVGRVNYDIEIPLLYDFVYRKDGRLLDRNAGAEVMSSVDDLQKACERHQRLWVVLTRDIHFRSPGETITWNEPGGRFDLFVRTNCELKYQTYLADVYLWDFSKGRMQDFHQDVVTTN